MLDMNKNMIIGIAILITGIWCSLAIYSYLDNNNTKTDEVLANNTAKIGQVVYNEDKTVCWEVQEKIGVLYYKIREDCPDA